jgi:hypothetical protein
VIDKYVEKLIALADRHTIIERGQVVWHRALGSCGDSRASARSRTQRVGAFGELSGDYSGLSSSQARA